MVEKENSKEPDEVCEMNLEEETLSPPSHPKQVVTTDEELKRLHHEAMDYKNKYLHLLADGENARKRLERERHEFARKKVETIIADFLHPIDSLESALGFAKEMSEEVSNWALGFKMILAQFKDVLLSQGVVAIQSKGLMFDPHVHEAIEMIETTAHPAGMIVEECIRGYKMGDRTIRPARVKVAKQKNQNEEKINQFNEEKAE